jgi:hypothetical protein
MCWWIWSAPELAAANFAVCERLIEFSGSTGAP